MLDFVDREDMVVRLVNLFELNPVVEVGVRHGDFARRLLEGTDARVYGIDSSLTPEALQLVGQYPGRFILLNWTSPGCATNFPDGHFGLVHIDADHSYHAVRADLAAWWPKVQPDGVLSGDDYAMVHSRDEGAYGVVQAVNEFVDAHGLSLGVTGCGHSRDWQLEHARRMGLACTRCLEGLPHEPFAVPGWYLLKPLDKS